MTASFISLSIHAPTTPTTTAVTTPTRANVCRTTASVALSPLRVSSFVYSLEERCNVRPKLNQLSLQPHHYPKVPDFTGDIQCDASEAPAKISVNGQTQQHQEKQHLSYAQQQQQQHTDDQHRWRQNLKPGAVVEAWLNGELRFGVVQELYERGSYVCFVNADEIPLSFAAQMKVSFGEIIAVWSSTLIINSSSLQQVGDYLLHVIDEATKLLRHATPKTIDLTRVYAAMRKLPKNDPRSSLKSAEICHALFRLKTSHTPFRRAVLTVATAILLASDTIHFKRSQPGYGWRALPASVTVSRGRCSFIEVCNAILEVRRNGNDTAQATVWSREQLDILRDLEVVAASGSGANGTAASVLDALGYEPNDDGAATLLLDINYWATGRYEARLQNRVIPKFQSVMSDADLHGADDASRQAAAAAAEAVAQRREREDTEWTFAPSLLAEARDIRTAAREKRKSYSETRTSRQNSKRRNLLHGQSAIRAYCIDEKSTRFLDDAVSIRVLDGGSIIRLWLHIVDVDEIVRSGSVLDTFAKERGQSMYLPLKPLHMLPAAAMDAASFSTSYPTEAVTVMIDLDAEKDIVRHWEVFASIIPPVTRVNYDQFDIAMEHGPKAAQLSQETYDDLLQIAQVAPLLADKLDHRRNSRKTRRSSEDGDKDGSPVDGTSNTSSDTGRRMTEAFDDRSVAAVRLVKRNDRAGTKGMGRIAKVVNFQMTGSHQVVNDILTCAGGVFRQFARENRAYLPEGRDAFLYVARCGTAPLRRYSDLAIQRQIKCVLFGRQPAGKRRMDELKIWLAKRSAAAERTVSERRRSALFESFSSFCAQKCAVSGAPRATIRGLVRNVAITKKGKLRIDVALDGTGLATTASVIPELEKWVLADPERYEDEADGTESKHERQLRVARGKISLNSYVQVEIDHIDTVGFAIRASIVHLNLH